MALPRIAVGDILGGSALRWGAIPATPPEWRVSDEELEGIEIHWPERYGCSYAEIWVAHLYYALRRRVRLRKSSIPQFGGETGPVALRVSIRGRWSDVAISPNDSPGTSFDFAERWALLFKMQFRNEGYAEPQIVPGGYTPDGLWIQALLPRLRRQRASQRFEHGVYGRFGTRFAANVRGPAMAQLSSQEQFPFTGGGKLVGYREFLDEVSRAKVCIDLPGNGPLCFRLINYLAIGACTVAYPHAARLPVPLQDRVHVAFTKPDLSDLVPLCQHFMERPEEREAMRVASQRYYDTYLHPANLASYYLRTMLDRLS